MRVFCDMGGETDPLLCAIKKYSKHSSILRIFQKSDWIFFCTCGWRRYSKGNKELGY